MSAIEALPRVSIELAGAPLDRATAAAMLALRVRQELSLPAACEIVLLAPAGGLPQDDRFLPGATIRVRLDDEAEILFDGEITSLQHYYGPSNQREVLLRGYDRLHRLRKRQPVRAWNDVRLEELASQLVADVGLTVSSEEEGPGWPRIMQWCQSDLQLLTEVAARCGRYFQVCGDSLQIQSLAGRGEDIVLEPGTSLLEARFESTMEPACNSVKVQGWDPWIAQGYEGRAALADLGREAQEAVPADAADWLTERTFVDEVTSSADHATLLAQAELDRRAMDELTMNGVAQGDARLRPGRRIRVQGVAPLFAHRYVVTSVLHTIDRERGFRSAFSTACPTAPPRSRAAVTTLGIVVDVNDPRKIGRVRVKLPNYCDLETDWLEVLSPGGGNGKGLVAVPDTGDRVLLLLPREDPAHGVVLGGLFALEGPPDAGVRGGRVQRYTFVTRGGQRLFLEEEHKVVRLENGAGSFVELAPGCTKVSNGDGSYVELARDRVRLHAGADLDIEAPGRALRFLSASVDFERG